MYSGGKCVLDAESFCAGKNHEKARWIRDKLTGGAARKVYLSGDARAKYGDIQAVVAKIRESGITNVVILTEKQPQH
ncbi:MAG: hypothetical protein JSS69_07535 [Acidobacteria bacterium]|nr:hypothetical protein [Acidobacteriota bacterium]MBS1865755.1 hypothetical protein [Acidobacteriota bacterium]